MLRHCPNLGLIFLLVTSGCQPRDEGVPRVEPNDNRVAAGKLENGVLTLQLEARDGRWFPDRDSGPSLVLQHFNEAGKAMQNPGPLIRVPAGTTIQLSVHSALRDSVLILYGMHTRPGTTEDSIHIAPGATRNVTFLAGEPGTYMYWGTTTHTPVAERYGVDSQLHGAFMIDPAEGPAHPDRIFVLGSWTGEEDRSGFAPELRVINGLSWPHTERLTYNAGDTVIWRWVNPSDSPHPMHLHGFYFDVTSRGNWAGDTVFAAGQEPKVVTEMPRSGQTFVMRWVPDEPGNWLLHCHVAYHTSLWLAARKIRPPDDLVTVDHVHGMRGMVLAVSVNAGASTARRTVNTERARNIRLVAQAAPKRFDNELDEMAFVYQQGDIAPTADSVPIPSSLLVLHRNEPVRITIVNHLRAATGVHWHGIEVPPYSDGVPDWSGHGSHIAPAIAPRDSFVAEFTPTRSGTFIYHAHSNEAFQITLGLYGGLLVVDSGVYQPERERLIILGSAGPGGERGVRFNGQLQPDTMVLKVGTAYRFRLIHIIADYTAFISLLKNGEPVQWKALAKDGAELPPSAQTMRRATLLAGPGETMDFEFTPDAPGQLHLDVRQRTGAFRSSLPIRVIR